MKIYSLLKRSGPSVYFLGMALLEIWRLISMHKIEFTLRSIDDLGRF